MSLSEILDWERQQAAEEARARRLEMERRFFHPGCPWGCDGSGWKGLEEGEEIGDLDVFHDGGWLTPCECNVESTHRQGRRYVWVKRYPPDYVQIEKQERRSLEAREGTCYVCQQPFVPAEPGQPLCPECLEAERREWEAERENRLAHVEALATL